MKIAFDHQIFTWQSYGGISRYVTQLSEGLLALGEDVSIFAGAYKNNYLSSLPIDVVKGFKLSNYPPKTGRLFQAVNHYWANQKIAQWQPDVIHETYYSMMPEPKKTLPRVITVHDMIHELYPQEFNVNDNASHWKRHALFRADHIISISQNTKNDLVELFDIKPEKISVIYHGAKNVQPIQKGVSNNIRPFLLYVGSRNSYKNFKRFIESVARSHQLKNNFNIVAFGGGAFDSNELRLIESLKFGVGQVSQKSGSDNVLSELYGGASAFVYPSLYEGFGLPPLEAMAYGCPVISSNTSSMPEVIDDAAEFFNPNSIEEISLAIENVVFSPSRSTELKIKGLRRAKEFSWKKCAQETLGIYKLLSG